MSDTLASLRRKIGGAGDLESVVRSMKALAAASIGQYEKSVLALTDYYRTVELGLAVCLRKRRRCRRRASDAGRTRRATTVNAIVFGSDQGLVGQFNDLLAGFVAKSARRSARRKEGLGRRRTHSLAIGGCRSTTGRTFRRANVRGLHHAAHRANPHRK